MPAPQAQALPTDLLHLQQTLMQYGIDLNAMLERSCMNAMMKAGQKVPLDFKLPENEKRLVVGLALDILKKNNALQIPLDDVNKFTEKLEKRCTVALTAGEAAANYFKMKILEKECQDLMKKIEATPDKSQKEKLGQELKGKLQELCRQVPDEKMKLNPALERLKKDLARPDCAALLVEKIMQGKFKTPDEPAITNSKDKTADDDLTSKPKSAKNDRDDPMDFAELTNEMLLGISNPSKGLGNPVVVTAIIPNSSGIADTNLENKANALYQDNEKQDDDLTQENVHQHSPFAMKPKGPNGQPLS